MLLVQPLCVLEWNVSPQNRCWWLTVVERREENSLLQVAVFWGFLLKPPLFSQSGFEATWTSLDNSSLPSAFGMAPHTDRLAEGTPEQRCFSLCSICTCLWFLLLSCPISCLVPWLFLVSFVGLDAPSPAVWAPCTGASWPLLRSLRGAVQGPWSHSQVLPSASQSCHPKEEDPSMVFPNCGNHDLWALTSHSACVITFRAVTWGPCCLILVVLGTYMSCKQEIVWEGPPSICQFSACSWAVWKHVLSSVGSTFSLSTVCLIFVLF